MVLAIAGSLSAEPASFVWNLPPGFPIPAVPEQNPMSEAKIALGASLFADTRLSGTGTYSCASCHNPDRHFTDGLPRAIGATGAQLRHNTPTLLNSAYNASYGWTDTGIETLELQHLVPLTNDDPIEMGFDTETLALLNEDTTLVAAFVDAFGTAEISIDIVAQALASYVRTLVRGDSAFDRLLTDDDRHALSDAAIRGLDLFTSPRLGCVGCHASFTLSGPIRHAGGGAPASFHFTGIGDAGETYRAPTLRFLSFTPPYMHDGSLETLGDVVDFYAAGGGSGAVGLQAFTLTDEERHCLIAFLESL